MTSRLLRSLGTGLLGLGLCVTVQAQGAVQSAAEIAAPSNGPVNAIPTPNIPHQARGGELYSNGPLANSTGTGSGGADESILEVGALSMGTLGFGHQISAGNRVADQFTVPAGPAWDVNEIIFYAYQTNGGIPSTIDNVNVRIWDGSPDNPASNIVFGDDTTNRLAATGFSNVYRVTDTSGGTTARAIMENTVTAVVSLAPGTYWLDWQTGGTAASGPWAPPIAIAGQCVTGDALQFTAAWAPAIDGGTSACAQGFPFRIMGSVVPVELTSFHATTSGTSVNLAWETASETNNAGFEVQMDRGTGFEALAFVAGNGTTTEAQTYSHTATNLAPGAYTFRLKQIDFDGAFEYSDEVEATIEVVGTHVLTDAYPNPFNPQATFSFTAAQSQAVTATLYNALGQRVAVLFEGTVEADQAQTVAINGAGLASGLYVVRVEGERFTDALRVTLLK